MGRVCGGTVVISQQSAYCLWRFPEFWLSYAFERLFLLSRRLIDFGDDIILDCTSISMGEE